MPAIDFLGWQQTTRKVDWKAASFPLSLSLFRLCALSLSLALSSHALWGGFAASFFQPPNKVIPVSTRSATCKQFSPRIRLASPSLSASARRMRCSHCCLPFCRYDCTLDAASALFVASSLESVCVGRRVQFQAPNDAVSERARHYVPGYVTLSWHRHRLRHRHRQRPQRLHMSRRAPCWRSFDLDLAALMQLPQHLLTVWPALCPAQPRSALCFYRAPPFTMCHSFHNCSSVCPPICLSCPSAPSICPLLVVSKRRVLFGFYDLPAAGAS